MNKKFLTVALIVFVLGSLCLFADKVEKVKCAVTGKEMNKADATITYVYQGTTYYFCCQGCKDKFVKDPEKMLKTVYTCPMHPEIVSDKAGKCSKCGMNLTAQKVPCCDAAKADCCKDKKDCADKTAMSGKCLDVKDGGCCALSCKEKAKKETSEPVKQ